MAEQYEITWDDGSRDIAEAVFWAATEGLPLVVTTADGRTVRMMPEVHQ